MVGIQVRASGQDRTRVIDIVKEGLWLLPQRRQGGTGGFWGDG